MADQNTEKDNEPVEVILYEDDAPGMEPETELCDHNDFAEGINSHIAKKNAANEPITINHPAFSYLRGHCISTSTAQAYINGYNH